MPTVKEFVDVAASPEAVSDVLLDMGAAPLWTSGLERLDLVEGVPGEAGCLGVAHYVEGGSQYTVEDRLLEAEPGHRFKSHIRGGGLKATIETTLQSTPDGTRVTIHWVGHGTNPVTRVMLPLLRRKIAARCRSDLEALGRLVESRATTN